MIKEREPILEKTSVFIQVLITVATFIAAHWLSDKFIRPLPKDVTDYQYLTILVILVWFIILDQFGLGKILRFKMYSTLFLEYFTALMVANLILYTAIVLLHFETISRGVLGIFALINLLSLFTFKFFLYSTMKFFRRRGYNTRLVLLIADEHSDYFIERLMHIPDWGYKVYGIMTEDSEIIRKYKKDCKIYIPKSDLSEIIDNVAIEEVIYCKSYFDQNEIQNYIYTCAEVGVIFRMQSQLLSFVKMQSKVSYLSQMPFLTFRNTPDNYLALKVKALSDIIISGLVLILVSPLLLIISALIKLDGGPVFFKQKRMGLHGRHFNCLKFRTMVTNAEELKAKLMHMNEQEGPVFKIKNDPRITRIGQFLRKTSLDELPQFINVLRGDMSIVGPRPPIPSEVKQYERWQSRRLSMKPGITCIWQVSGRNNIPFHEWMKMDMQYIDNWSLKLDFIILLKTVKVVLTGDGQ
ncbi:sugar transferase [Saccharicrinis sp. FJH54]|uniref:sugar transferase n=1 Tax=Saccharicrinis sp. FJH54 TaxID=3344665 RepID=UPI0035D4D74B